MANYPRVNYEMTEDDLKGILDACKPVPCIMIGSFTPSSPQENANCAWAKLGKEMGFDSMTVRPIEGKSQRFFSAVPSENEAQKAERIKDENKARLTTEVEKLEAEIKEKQDALYEANRELSEADNA